MTTLYRISNEEYAKLFDENDRVELIDGQIYNKMNIGDAHVRVVNNLA